MWWHALLESLPPAVLALYTRTGPSRLIKSTVSSVGRVAAASILVHFTGGLTESHFHWFLVLSLCGSYIDIRPFLAAVGYTLVHHAGMSIYDPSLVFETDDGRAHPWLWSGIHVVFVVMLMASIAANWVAYEQQTKIANTLLKAQENDIRHRATIEADMVNQSSRLATSSAGIQASMDDVSGVVSHFTQGTSKVLAQKSNKITKTTTEIQAQMADSDHRTGLVMERVNDIAGVQEDIDRKTSEQSSSAQQMLAQVESATRAVSEIISSVQALNDLMEDDLDSHSGAIDLSRGPQRI